MLGWHFTAATLRDGRPVPPIGETLTHEGPLKVRRSGLHASEHPFDALRYAPGPILHRVRSTGTVSDDDDEAVPGERTIVSTERTILATRDATLLLDVFARRCALSAIDKWDAPAQVRRYLEHGIPGMRDSAWQAARDAAWTEGADKAGLVPWRAGAAWTSAVAAIGGSPAVAAGAAAIALKDTERKAQRRHLAELVVAEFADAMGE